MFVSTTYCTTNLVLLVPEPPKENLRAEANILKLSYKCHLKVINTIVRVAPSKLTFSGL